LKDKTKLLDGIAAYLPDVLRRQVEVLDFPYPESEYPTLKGKTFQVLLVPDDPEHLPFVAARDGEDVNATVIYTRRNMATVPVDHEELQRIISRRVETGYSSRRELDLREHLEQLRVLYEQLGRPDPGGSEGGVGVLLGAVVGGPDLAQKMLESSPESFGKFVWRVIEKKKQLIESELGFYSVFHRNWTGRWYPPCSKNPRASLRLIAEIATPSASIRAWRVLAPVFRKVPLIFEKASSMGLKSGEYGGR
jgi:hypothetical protein